MMEILEKKLAAAEQAAAAAIESSPHPDNQAMVAWVKNSCWAGPNTNFYNALDCCVSDAHEGEFNDASREDVRRWLARWDAAQAKHGVNDAKKRLNRARAAARAAEAAEEEAAFCRIAGETPEAFKKRLWSTLSIFEREEVNPSDIFARIENGEIVAGFTLYNDAHRFIKKAGRWEAAMVDGNRDYSSYEYYFAD